MEQPIAKLLCNKYDLSPIVFLIIICSLVSCISYVGKCQIICTAAVIPHVKQLKIVTAMKLLCHVNGRNVYIHLLARRGCFNNPLLC
jgi:hypothetical protein